MLIFVPLMAIAPPFLAFPVATDEEEFRIEVEMLEPLRMIELPLLELPAPVEEKVFILPVLIFLAVFKEIPALLPLLPVVV